MALLECSPAASRRWLSRTVARIDRRLRGERLPVPRVEPPPRRGVEAVVSRASAVPGPSRRCDGSTSTIVGVYVIHVRSTVDQSCTGARRRSARLCETRRLEPQPAGVRARVRVRVRLGVRPLGEERGLRGRRGRLRAARQQAPRILGRAHMLGKQRHIRRLRPRARIPADRPVVVDVWLWTAGMLSIPLPRRAGSGRTNRRPSSGSRRRACRGRSSACPRRAGSRERVSARQRLMLLLLLDVPVAPVVRDEDRDRDLRARRPGSRARARTRRSPACRRSRCACARTPRTA